MSYLRQLVCSQCGRAFDPRIIQTYCHDCQAPLLADYDLEAARSTLDRDIFRQRIRGMWRWHELLPVFMPENEVSLGEGDTPLLHLAGLGQDLGLPHLYAKDESLNPTGTFKARGLAVAVSKAKELGVQKVIIPTAGNAGGAMAAYAARCGIEACIYMPRDTPQANVAECLVTGASVILVDGLISDAAAAAGVRARQEGWFDLSTFREPYRCEGKKVMGYELAEEFEWHLPDVIIYPTGGGTGLVGMWKAFLELQTLGWLETNALPRMVAVQAAGCAPVIKAFEAGAPACEFWQEAHTVASGLRVPKSFADRIILHDLRASSGTAIAVRDDELPVAQGMLATQEGIFAAPEGAATVAALVHLLKQGWIHKGERIVQFNTGTGLKYLS
jgi:threonine synthase